MGDPFVRPGVPCMGHIENIVLRHTGTGTAYTTPELWATDQYRDTLSTIVQRYDLLQYTSLSTGTSTARLRHMLLEKMVDPLESIRSDAMKPSQSSGSGGGVEPIGVKRKRE